MNTTNEIQHTLRKINNTFIISSNEDIPVGMLYVTEIGQIATCIEIVKNHIRGRISIFETCRTPIKECSKIIASDNIPDTFRIDFNGYQKTVGYVDVDMLAYADSIQSNTVEVYKKGFYRNQELNSDKRFTINDVKNAFASGLNINSDFSDGDETTKYLLALELSKLLKWKIEVSPNMVDNDVIINKVY